MITIKASLCYICALVPVTESLNKEIPICPDCQSTHIEPEAKKYRKASAKPKKAEESKPENVEKESIEELDLDWHPSELETIPGLGN